MSLIGCKVIPSYHLFHHRNNNSNMCTRSVCPSVITMITKSSSCCCCCCCGWPAAAALIPNVHLLHNVILVFLLLSLGALRESMYSIGMFGIRNNYHLLRAQVRMYPWNKYTNTPTPTFNNNNNAIIIIIIYLKTPKSNNTVIL